MGLQMVEEIGAVGSPVAQAASTCREYSGPPASTIQKPGFDPRPFVFGGVAAIIAEMVTFPLDTAKTRLQLQGQVGWQGWKDQKYRGTLQTVACIVREEGVATVYKGLSPAIARQATYGTIKFGLYYTTKDVASRVLLKKRQKESTLVNLGCAVFAGSLSSAVANPMDVMKVRMQSRTGLSLSSTGLYETARDIWRTEGIAGLWRGVCPTAKRAALLAGVQLPVYDSTKSKLEASKWVILQQGAPCHLLSSFVAAFSACLASNPVDVIRTRMMVQRNINRQSVDESVKKCKLYKSAWQCFIHTVKTEGLKALYKGFVPAFARMGPWNIIFFLVYEKLKSSEL